MPQTRAFNFAKTGSGDKHGWEQLRQKVFKFLQAGQQRNLIQKVDEYMAWAAEDPKLVGMAPWHYGNRPSAVASSGRLGLGAAAASAVAAAAAAASGGAGGGTHALARTPPPSYVDPSLDHGAAQYPEFVQHLLTIGWRNISQFMPAELCGLV